MKTLLCMVMLTALPAALRAPFIETGVNRCN